MIDLDRATAFMATNARLVDRRRLAHALGPRSPEALLSALDAYRNVDGGYGSGLEPDLRSTTSQPAGALHAFEVLAEAAPVTTPCSVELCDWLQRISGADGGMPFALAISDPAGCAPFWLDADSATSSLHITAAVTSLALKVARHDATVASHAWLHAATNFCFERLRTGPPPEHALEIKFAMHFLDAATDSHPEASDHLVRLRQSIPPDGRQHVAGGLDDEFMTALDFAPEPDRPARALFAGGAIDADLARLAAGQGDDGGWPSEWASYSPIAIEEWRGYLTVRAITLLLANGRLDGRIDVG
jgi:hypothetical protein